MTKDFGGAVGVNDGCGERNYAIHRESNERHGVGSVVKIGDFGFGHSVWVEAVESHHDAGTNADENLVPEPTFHIDDFIHYIYVVNRNY